MARDLRVEGVRGGGYVRHDAARLVRELSLGREVESPLGGAGCGCGFLRKGSSGCGDVP